MYDQLIRVRGSESLDHERFEISVQWVKEAQVRRGRNRLLQIVLPGRLASLRFDGVREGMLDMGGERRFWSREVFDSRE